MKRVALVLAVLTVAGDPAALAQTPAPTPPTEVQPASSGQGPFKSSVELVALSVTVTDQGQKVRVGAPRERFRGVRGWRQAGRVVLRGERDPDRSDSAARYEREHDRQDAHHPGSGARHSPQAARRGSRGDCRLQRGCQDSARAHRRSSGARGGPHGAASIWRDGVAQRHLRRAPRVRPGGEAVRRRSPAGDCRVLGRGRHGQPHPVRRRARAVPAGRRQYLYDLASVSRHGRAARRCTAVLHAVRLRHEDDRAGDRRAGVLSAADPGSLGCLRADRRRARSPVPLSPTRRKTRARTGGSGGSWCRSCPVPTSAREREPAISPTSSGLRCRRSG